MTEAWDGTECDVRQKRGGHVGLESDLLETFLTNLHCRLEHVVLRQLRFAQDASRVVVLVEDRHLHDLVLAEVAEAHSQRTDAHVGEFVAERAVEHEDGAHRIP